MNRKIVAALSVVAVTVLAQPEARAATSTSNLVANPGYDSGLTRWSKYSSSSTLRVASSAGSSGNGLKITASGSGNMGVKQTLTQKSVAGATYAVTASLKAGSHTSTVNGGLVVRETRSNGTRLTSGVSSSIQLISSSFTTITYRYTAQYDGSTLTVVARSTRASAGEILDVDEWNVTTGTVKSSATLSSWVATQRLRLQVQVPVSRRPESSAGRQPSQCGHAVHGPQA